MSKATSGRKIVSVVMPTYNQAEYIEEAIASVLKQTYGELELIVIDNFSTDGTEEIVRRCLRDDKRVVYKKYRNNGILANSRNLGIEMARGEFVAFVDSDDVWHKEKLEKQIPLFGRKQVGFVYSRQNSIDENGKVINRNRFSQMYRGRILEKCLAQSFSFANSSVVLRKNLLDQNELRFRVDRQGTEDWDLWLRIAGISEGDYIDEALVLYRVHNRCISGDPKLMHDSAVLTINDYERHILEGYPDEDSSRNRLLRACRFSRIICMHTYASASCGKGYFVKASKMSVQAMVLRPLDLVAWKMIAKTFIYSMQRALRS